MRRGWAALYPNIVILDNRGEERSKLSCGFENSLEEFHLVTEMKRKKQRIGREEQSYERSELDYQYFSFVPY